MLRSCLLPDPPAGFIIIVFLGVFFISHAVIPLPLALFCCAHSFQVFTDHQARLGFLSLQLFSKGLQGPSEAAGAVLRQRGPSLHPVPLDGSFLSF